MMATAYADDVHGINTVANSGHPDDDYGHGSHVSGTLGAVGNNRVGVVGVCWRVQIMACKFLDAHGEGSISDAIKCIDYARVHGARVINASWGSTTSLPRPCVMPSPARGTPTSSSSPPAAIRAATTTTRPARFFPASYALDNIIAVAATTRTDDLAGWSNYGATTVHLAAAGHPDLLLLERFGQQLPRISRHLDGGRACDRRGPRCCARSIPARATPKSSIAFSAVSMCCRRSPASASRAAG